VLQGLFHNPMAVIRDLVQLGFPCEGHDAFALHADGRVEHRDRQRI
jgi:hypothetical protein